MMRPRFHAKVTEKITETEIRREGNLKSGCAENPTRRKLLIRLMFCPRAISLLSAAFRAPECNS